MTDQQAALTLDRALDGERGFDLNGSQPLLTTAETVQTLFDRQKGIPTELFLMQLECQLFPSVDNPASSKSSPAPAMPVRRPSPIGASRKHRFSHLLAAIAAALLLFFGGAAAIIFEGFGLQSSPEPSAIPAIGFGTAEASPEPVGELWKVDPLPSTQGSDKPPVIANGVAFRTFMGSNTSPIQAVDVQTGDVIWAELPRIAPELMGATDDLLLIAGSNGKMAGFRYELVALDGQSGKELWSEPLASAPVGLQIADGKIFLLGSDNLLQAFDPNSHKTVWEADLTRYVDSFESRVNSFSGFTGDRIALSGETLGVIVGNGRLIGLDADDGQVKWADTRRTNGWTRLAVVAGNFVVTAFGPESLYYDPDATPIPVTPPDPTIVPCTLTIGVRDGVTPLVPAATGATVDAFDPETGASPWGLEFPEQYSVWPVGETQLVAQVEPVQSAGVADSSDLISCSIDGVAGAVSQTSGTEFAELVFAGVQTGEPTGVGTSSSGVVVWAGPIDSAIANRLPMLDTDIMSIGGFRWVQKVPGMFLITGQDGTMIGLPMSVSPQSSPTAGPTEVGWTVPAPEGIANMAEGGNAHEIADGRVFRAFAMKQGSSRLQAVDAGTGDVLWETDIESSDVLLQAVGNLLLVAEPSASNGDPQLVALGAQTGDQVWTATLSDVPVAMFVVETQVLVLGMDDRLDAVELDSGQAIYAVDIRGGAANQIPPDLGTSRINALNQHRMAVDGETLYATLADGSVVAVELQTGVGNWWSLRPTPGDVQIYAIDGAIVTVDNGDLEAITAQFHAEFEADRSGTPLPATPIPAGSTTSCLGTRVAGTPMPTAGEVITTYRGLDSRTGKVLWTTELPAQSIGQAAIDAGILYEVWATADWPSDRSELAVCIVDPHTGEAQKVDPLEDFPGRFVLFNRNADVSALSIVVVLENSQSFFVPASYAPELIAPVVTLDETFSDGWWWNEIYGDAIYLSQIDGDLVKIPIPAE